jgi:hypothetical protein
LRMLLRHRADYGPVDTQLQKEFRRERHETSLLQTICNCIDTVTYPL